MPKNHQNKGCTVQFYMSFNVLFELNVGIVASSWLNRLVVKLKHTVISNDTDLLQLYVFIPIVKVNRIHTESSTV